MKSIFSGVLVAFFVAASMPAIAEQSKRLGDWDVHYMAVNSDFFAPEVLREYGILRSKRNAVINISALDKETQVAQALALDGTATNLLGVTKPLVFKQVREGDAIYYLAQLSFRDQERYRFVINLKDGNQTQTLRFEQLFHAN